MSKFIYQAKFNLSQEVTDKGFKKAQSDLDVVSDLGEMITEGPLKRETVVRVKARLSSHKTGLITLTSPRELTDEEFQAIHQTIKFELEEDDLLVGLETETETVGDLANYTNIVWTDDNQFKLVNQYVSTK